MRGLADSATEDPLVRIEEKVDGLAEGLVSVGTRVDKHEANVEVLRDDVKLIAEGHIATQELINRRFDEVVALIDQRLPPFEAAIRHHSAVLRHHNLTAGPDTIQESETRASHL